MVTCCRRRHAASLTALVAAGAALGCGFGGLVGRGMSLYSAGDYGSAMEIWGDVAPYEAELNDKGRARYLVYRGLTHFRRGEGQLAVNFLTRGREAYHRGHPSWLPAQALLELNQALDALGQAEPAPVPTPHGAPLEPAR